MRYMLAWHLTPWRADKIPGGYVVRGANGQARPTDIAKALKIGRASVYRVLGQKVTN